MLYLLGSGVTHGLYYNQRISDETWSVVQKVYAPVDWVESKLGEDNVIFNLKYWWYIKINMAGTRRLIGASDRVVVGRVGLHGIGKLECLNRNRRLPVEITK